MIWNWMSREEWAKHRRSIWADEENPYAPSKRLADYASGPDIQQARAQLKTLWLRLGRELTAAKRAAGALAQQPHESNRNYVQRYLALSTAEQGLVDPIYAIRHNRKLINTVLRAITHADHAELPWQMWTVIQTYGGDTLPALRQIQARWEEATRVAHDKWQEEVANRPIDDAACEEELKRRHEIENPKIERINVF